MKNKKCASGIYGVYHTGKMEYSVYNDRNNALLGKRSNLSEAFALANRLYEAAKNGS